MVYQRRKEHRPDEILAAALDVFAEKGYAGTRLSDIATRAGVSRPTLYLYYPNKLAILEALLQSRLKPLLDTAEQGQAAFEGPASALLETVVRRLFATILQDDVARLLYLIMTEAAHIPEIAELYLSRIVGPGRGLLGGILAYGVERGEFRPGVQHLDARLLVAPGLVGVLWRSLFAAQEDLDTEKLISDHLSLLLHGMRADRDPDP